ncbi:glutamine--fructose-6-phosphate transaminase (isomerizing) [Desulfotruncus alcoholivorax]|uniref:glutamine--fructose-6-phosphate transaminase (isomerizing) n=1 Tax=Desulfotruncus alcoholivorax TaxID=265477 RepID=UPI00040F67EC|nr:glutamine--fructose-6-phosphate transaminase (isomerizing) [Desulfotruncus alcoholivorax]
MCGIVGYLGGRQAAPILLEGLQKLEYRGYDSAGIAVIQNNAIEILKKSGKLAQLRAQMNGYMPESTAGIGHTRWATHGRPNDVNAHPHLDCQGRFAVVHNGIIENYLTLREWLISQGHVFRSETDTEVLPHLLEEFYMGDMVETIQRVIKKVDGSYAMVALALDEPNRLVAARHDSPLVVGLGEGENFLASDIPALLKHTRETYILEDGEIAVLTRQDVEVLDHSGRRVDKKVFHVKWEAAQAEKGGYDHFMLKEIHEQPRALKDTLSGRIAQDGSRVILNEINIPQEQLQQINKVVITACGTAFHAGLVGKNVIETLAGIPVEADIASELRYRNPLIDANSLVIVISQSGETADTLAALREAKRKGARVIAVTNVVDSSVAREADDVLYTWAGPEIAVASTKAYITQLLSMYLLGLYLAQNRGTLKDREIAQIITDLRKLPDKVASILENGTNIKEFVREHCNCENAFFIGRGLDYAVAMEGSLKLKEISYIHAEAYAAGELKHGTLALIVKDVPVVALVTQQALYDKTVSNIKEVKAREATVLAVATRGLEEVSKVADEVLYIPRTHQMLTPILAVVPLQLLAYYMAVSRGCDVDQPRNLAKSVTVE